MRVLLHFTDVTQPPVGGWWVDEGDETQSRSYYLPGREAEAVVGKQVMSQKSPEATWRDYFNDLEGRPPMVNAWESAEVFEPPDKFIQRLAKFTGLS